MAGEVLTLDEIENCVSRCKGTWVKRRNMKARLIKESNEKVAEKIEEARSKIRDLRAIGAREQDLRFWYGELSKLEMLIIS